MKRYMLRHEPENNEPNKNPIKAIILDRREGKYFLLDSPQTKIVDEAIAGILNGLKYLRIDKPFPIDLDLTTLKNDTQKIELKGKTPENVLAAPITAYTEISTRCNLDCKDCYQGKRIVEHPLADEEIINFLKRFQEIGGMIVRFTGKEPTTHPNLRKYIRLGRELGLKMALNTNGNIGTDYAESLVEAGIQEAVVSLDGDEEFNDSIRGIGVQKRAIQTLRTFLANGVDARINMTISKSNSGQLEYVMRLAKAMGTYVSVIPMRDLGNASENLRFDLLSPSDMMQLVRQFKNLQAELETSPKSFIYFNIISPEPKYYHPFFQMTPCVARKNIFLDCEGNIYPCDHLVNLGKTFCGGNIRQNDLLDIWQFGSGLERYRQLKRNKTCLACKEFEIRCDGGCSSEYLVSCGGDTDEVMDRLCFVNSLDL
jgi:radical SAM protein with 4Fe4S-binding SPASM domain